MLSYPVYQASARFVIGGSGSGFADAVTAVHDVINEPIVGQYDSEAVTDLLSHWPTLNDWSI